MNDTRILAPKAMACFACNQDANPEQSTVVEVSMLAPGLGIAVAICPACTARAIDRDGSADTLIAEIRDQYSAGVTFARPSEVPATASPSITLRRRGIGAHPRRHPAYGKSLAENPPPADEPLNIALGWPNAKNLPAPLLVVQPEDNPARLRFDVADGRRVRVAHPSNADPDHLLKLAQALIDHGATCVDLIVHPPRPGATERERLRVLVESDA